MNLPTPLSFSPQAQQIAALIFGLAVLHTFCAGAIAQLAHRHPRWQGPLHLLGEVELVFGFWAVLLLLALWALEGPSLSLHYLETRQFTEPLFVWVVMVMAASRPVLLLAEQFSLGLARALPLPAAHAQLLVFLVVVPLMGSLITEPAAMTLAAVLLSQGLLHAQQSRQYRYAVLGVLFVNVSIGGTLTSFAAPPVLMVAGPWGWDSAFLLQNLGWKAALAVLINGLLLVLVFRKTLSTNIRTTTGQQQLQAQLPKRGDARPQPAWPMTLACLGLLAGVVYGAHHPSVFLLLFLVFLGLVKAFPADHDRLLLPEGLLVALFLGGLVVIGGMQSWWLSPLLSQLGDAQVFWGTAALTALTDNAALTYLAAQVPGLSPSFQLALVAGAVTGGGLTLIANAPNPAGAALLRSQFPAGQISPVPLLLAALVPTLMAAACLRLL